MGKLIIRKKNPKYASALRLIKILLKAGNEAKQNKNKLKQTNKIVETLENFSPKNSAKEKQLNKTIK